jgi:hypothetical protein
MTGNLHVGSRYVKYNIATNDLYTEATGKAREQEGVISVFQINLPQIKEAIQAAVGKKDVDLGKLAEDLAKLGVQDKAVG